jgi:hypothetical protein
MSKSIPEQLRFPPLDGYTVRADFEGGTYACAKTIQILNHLRLYAPVGS